MVGGKRSIDDVPAIRGKGVQNLGGGGEAVYDTCDSSVLGLGFDGSQTFRDSGCV